MSQTARTLIQRVWRYAHVLKDDGLAFMDYTEQITYLLFLKMAWEQRDLGANQIPSRYTWGTLKNIVDNTDRLTRYHQALHNLSKRAGLVGLIFTKPQSKINDPAKLQLLMQMIDAEEWSVLDVDVKGEVYEGLLARNADDVRGGAGQYFTPRPVIRAIVQVMRPQLGIRISDPACGTGGFLLGAFEYLKAQVKTLEDEQKLHSRTFSGADLVPNVARLCAMNLFLRGIYTDENQPVVEIKDSLLTHTEPVDMVLTNPPFGKKSSFTIVGKSGRPNTEKLSYNRPDFWATTSNKQLNFLQHVYTMLKDGGTAAVVVPDNVLFEGGAGERIRRSLLTHCNVHTLLRLPTGIWYSPGVKANVLFFEKVPLSSRPATRATWIYDLRTDQNFSLRNNPIRFAHLTDFIKCFSRENLSSRRQTDLFRRYSYSDIIKREKANLDISWNRAAQDADHNGNPHALLKEIIEDLQEAIREFAIAEERIR